MKMPGNMQNMMKQAQVMQQKLQEQIAAIRVEASAGGGMITVKMDGQKNVLGVKIDPEVAGDVEMLQDMVMAAFTKLPRKWMRSRRAKWVACWVEWACPQACSRPDSCQSLPSRWRGSSKSVSGFRASDRSQPSV